MESTPLELLNLHLTEGKSKGEKTNKFYHKFNREFTWDALLTKGYQTDLAPVLYQIVSKNYPYSKEITISNEIKDKLKILYNQFLVINLIQFNELDKILNTFEMEGIDVIQLKGAELAKNYYPDQALRPMGDIDLLVRKKDMKRAKEVLMSMGYKFGGKGLSVGEDFYEKKHFHFPYKKHSAIASIFVELHYDISVNSLSISNNIDDFWENAMPINGKHKHIFIIPKELLLLHVFWHTYLNLSNKLYLRLIWLLDIAYILSKDTDGLNWVFIEKKANEWGIKKQVYFCLYLTTQLLNNRCDEKIMRKLMPPRYSIKIFDFIMLKVENNIKPSKDTNGIYIILLNLLSLHTINKKIYYLFGGYNSENFLDKKERIRKRYGLSSEILTYIFYIFHSIMLIFKGIKWGYEMFRPSDISRNIKILLR